MIDMRTTFLVATAVASPYLLQGARTAGIPIPVYVTAGQTAALAAFPATISGVALAQTGTGIADSKTFFALWNTWNTALRTKDGVATDVTNYSVGAWNATQFANLTLAEAREFGAALIASANAGMSAGSDGYPASLADGDAYQTLTGTLAIGSVSGLLSGSSDADAHQYIEQIFALVLQLDYIGVLPSGKPFVPTVGGGLSAASSAVADFAKNIAGDAAGRVMGVAADAALSTPVLALLAALLVYKAVRK